MSADGSLIFDTGVDQSGFDKGVSSLKSAAGVAMGTIAAEIISNISAAISEIPKQMVAVGSTFEASMSQVAATMGITSAADDFKVLSDAAKEMGEATKFSASQASEALNYLALAGYDAELSVAALPTLLSVAAAGGIELGRASDLITDSMSALGLETSQMAVFADQLAVAAQKSNASVAQLGEAVLTVGGTAKDMAGGITEMNTVLGVLADNGIKGAEGGTALRNIILSLSAPTDKAKEAIEGLGISVFDSAGNMRELPTVFGELNDVLSSLSQENKNKALSEIFNNVDLKSVNALLGTSAERFDALSGYIENSANAASEMAKTMDDNLKGDMTIMQSAIEGLGIAAYEKFSEPMRDGVQSVTESIGSLSQSLQDGALSDSFDKLSSVFSSAMSDGAEHLANDIIPSVINGMEAIVDHGEDIISVAAGIGAGFLAFNITAGIIELIGGLQLANVRLTLLAAESGAAAISQAALAGSLTVSEVAAGVFTGQISLATAAQAGFNAVLNLNPAILVATGLGLLTVGVIKLASHTNGATESTKKYADEMKRLQENGQSILDKSNQEIALLKTKADRYEELRSKLDTLNSSEMAEFLGLVDDLKETLPEGTAIIDEQTGAYNSLAGSIDTVIEKMRVQAMLNSKQGAYETALARNYDIDEEIKQLEIDKNKDTNGNAFKYQAKNETIPDEIKALEKQRQENQKLIDEYEEIYKGMYEQYGEDITNVDISSNADTPNVDGLSETISDNTKALQGAWAKAEHDYAIGVIGSDAELLAKKRQIWNAYGDESSQDHWSYLEDLYKSEKQYNEDIIDEQKKTTEEQQKATDEYKKSLQDKWNSIDKLETLGVISEEDAYKQRLEFIEQYCPEYSDEWYDYYKTIYDYQQSAQDESLKSMRDNLNEQVDSVKNGIADIVDEYKKAYDELEGDIDSYKNKLISVGDAISVTTKKDKKGNETKTFKVEDMRTQIAEMQRYHDSIKALKDRGISSGWLEEINNLEFDESSFVAKNLAGMSDADFAQMNDQYKKRDEVASSLANELYAPEMDALNNSLVSSVTEKFGTLPDDIEAIGSETVSAFLNGVASGDLSGGAENLLNDFFSAVNSSIDEGKFDALLSESLADAFDIDTYTLGKNMGDDFSNGFNDGLSATHAVVSAEQENISAEYKAKSKTDAESSRSTDKSEKIVVDINERITLEVDGEKMAEKVIEKTEVINRRKGK